MRLTEPKDSHQGLVDTPLLLRAHRAHKFAKPPCIDGADLLNQDTGGLTKQLDLGAERCRLGAARRWCDQNHRARQELVGLNDYAIALALLLVTGPAREAEFVHVTPQHA
jgi:hypothetical protein